MEFKHLELNEFDDFFNILLNNFPIKEIKDRSFMGKTFKQGHYQVLTLRDDNKIIGVMSYYKSEDFTFIDYFAIDGSYKGQGLGSKMLKYFFDLISDRIILEVEYPEDHQSIRRISFYQRCGLVLNDQYNYFVPPIRSLKQRLYFHLMSYPNEITAIEFEIFYPKILKLVYGIN